MLKLFLAALLAITFYSHLCANVEKPCNLIAIEVPEDFMISNLDPSQVEGQVGEHDTYLEAYLQGSLDSKFPRSGVVVKVRSGSVLLANLPKDKQRAERIVSYVKSFVANSDNGHLIALAEVTEKSALNENNHNGRWLPQSTVLYPPELANPYRVCFSGGIRLRDSVAGQVCTPVSFGDQFPLYRWSNVDIWKYKGDMQLEIEGSVFAIFNQTHYSSPLINADYYVAMPVTYAYDKWAHRVRLYHISSHLGDEYMKHHRHVKRLNKSYEAVDYFASYNITKQIRLYGGAGVIFHSDSEMHLRPLYAGYGMEVHAFRHDWKQLYGCPYIAMHFQNWQDVDWKIDATFALGYEWGKINGMGKKIRMSLEYHNGFNDAGQFSRIRNDYIQAKLSYGF